MGGTVGKKSWRVRYRDANGAEKSVGGFRSSKAACAYAEAFVTDRRRGLWIDPARSATPLEQWARSWVETLDVEPRTEENYRRCLRVHVLPRWGSVPLGGILASEVALWLKELRERYAASTVATIRTVLSICLDDAVDDRLIPANPVRARRRRGRRRDRGLKPVEKAWAMPEQVLRIANNAAVLGGRTARLLIITAAWTGCRWGELAGLHRDSVDLDHGRGTITIDPLVGSLHESARELWLGPPKTPASAREIQLPPFLTALLREHLARHDHPMVFTSPRGRYLRRSCSTAECSGPPWTVTRDAGSPR